MFDGESKHTTKKFTNLEQNKKTKRICGIVNVSVIFGKNVLTHVKQYFSRFYSWVLVTQLVLY